MGKCSLLTIFSILASFEFSCISTVSQFRLEFHKEWRMPSSFMNIPEDENSWFIPVGELWPNILSVWLVNSTSGALIEEGPNSFANLTIQLISKKVADGLASEDTWSGSFCNQDGIYRQHSPHRRTIQSNGDENRCFNQTYNYTMDKEFFSMYKGEMFLRFINFQGEDFANDPHFIRFSYVPVNENEPLILDTPPFIVTAASKRPVEIELDEPVPVDVVANNPFEVKVKIVNDKNETVTSGFLSKANVMFSVARFHKWWWRTKGEDYWLHSTDAVLAGDNVVVSTVINDRIIFKNTSAGKATITARIEDIHDVVYLNVTVRTNYRPFRRFFEFAFHYAWYGYVGLYWFDNPQMDDASNSTLVRYIFRTYDPNYFPCSLITNITVVAQTPLLLRIVPGHVMKSPQMANRQIDHPIQVELIDVNGYRVTSGPDSQLMVTTSVVGSGQLSVDSAFRLQRGVGTFPGSLVGAASDVALTFSANSSVGILVTNSSATFTVTTEIYLAAHSGSVSEKIFKEMAVKDINDGRHSLLSALSGRLIVLKSATTCMDMLKIVYKDKEAPSSKTAAVSISGDELTIDTCSAVAEAYGIPTVVHRTSNPKFSDKALYPLVSRISYSERYKFMLIARAMKSRLWTNVVVIAELGTTTPPSVSEMFQVFGIQSDTIVFLNPKDAFTPIEQTFLDGFFNALRAAKTKTIFSLLSGYALNHLVAESTKRGFTPAQGYQWVGEERLLNSFPYNNEGLCASLNRTCTEEFKGTTIFTEHIALSLANPEWNRLESLFPGTIAVDEAPQLAIAYDSIIAIAHGLNSLIAAKKTVTAESLKLAINRAYFYGLSGTVVFEQQNGERGSYSGIMLQMQPSIAVATGPSIVKPVKYIYMHPSATPDSVRSSTSSIEYMVTGAEIIYAAMPTAWNDIRFLTIQGSINADLTISGNSTSANVTEKVPPSHYCSAGCGGRLLSTSNHYIWEYGTCASQDACRCNIDPFTKVEGYSGASCGTIVCGTCLYGLCSRPSVCTCNPGYVHRKGKTDCGQPTCLTFGCINGSCTTPDFCACQPGFYGKDCSRKCTCLHGSCNEGESGNGRCSCLFGYTGSKCDVKIVAIAVPVVLGSAALLTLIALLAYRRYKHVQLMGALMSTDWKANWDDIRLRQGRNRSSMKSGISMMSMMSARSGKREERFVCQNQGNWNGKEIVIKLLRKGSVDLTKTIRWEIKQMKDLKHPNLCAFIGAIIESPHVAVLNELCGKGSLEDVLYNDDHDLSWDFKYSMLKDICRGMQFLHNSDLGSHGRLKTSNCLVDNRWTVKISDYGMKEFKNNLVGVRIFNPGKGVGIELPTEADMEGCDYYALLWTAPEIIRTGVSHPSHVGYGTPKGDLYSFGVIIAEMCTRSHPFHEVNFLGSEQIVPMVGGLIPLDPCLEKTEFTMTDGRLISTIRPEVSEDQLPTEDSQKEGILELLSRCWHEEPEQRPRFSDCMSLLNRISPHRGELMDNLMVLMEQYTNSLEAIVAERTADLAAEKAASDSLLMKMLPPLIAEELKLGKNPVPEFFNCVTIYFSDIVGFAKICAHASPFQVVDLLNDLYSVMDDVIESFDCYKVETIGDCYVVASGLPLRNGDKHAGEMASMALHLLARFNGVGYKHLPGSQIQLRVGMHSGPIVAGVVGLRMPRYCLFGDTMNTASRMESGGYALKIHLSEDTQKILTTLGGYIFECRGERQVKGRGLMTTYWLKGKSGLDLVYPSEDKAASLSEHDLK